MKAFSIEAFGNTYPCTFATPMIVPVAPKPTVICKDSTDGLIGEKLLELPQVVGWERFFLEKITKQRKLSAPQKRKLEAICDRHLRKCPNCNGWVMTDINSIYGQIKSICDRHLSGRSNCANKLHLDLCGGVK